MFQSGGQGRGTAVEFGPAEVIDSVIIRPIALYAGPFILGNVAVGWVVGSILADIAFYVMAFSAMSASPACWFDPRRAPRR